MATRSTILMVEGDRDNAALLRDLLGAKGYRVLTVASATDAVALLRAFRAQLVITDAPRQDHAADPWVALEPLRVAAGGAPIILCSGHDTGLYADYATHGCAAFLAKPFDPDQLAALVASLLHGEGRAGAESGRHALEQVV